VAGAAIRISLADETVASIIAFIGLIHHSGPSTSNGQLIAII